MKFLLLIPFLFLLSCGLQPRSQQLKNSLVELKRHSSQNSSQQLVEKGEKSLQIFDESGYIEAEELAQTGLTSLTWESFEESLLFFEMALEKDQGNEKALFYLALLRPIKHMKGISWRITSLSQSGWAEQDGLSRGALFNARTPNASFYRYLSTPYRKKINSQRGFVQEFIAPFTQELAKSDLLWQRLLTNPNIDLQVTLPEPFQNAISSTRVRSGDLQVLKSFYRTEYIFFKLFSAYQAPNIKYSISEQPDFDKSMIFRFQMNDPAFAILTDPNIFIMLKDDMLNLIESFENAFDDLKSRFLNNENDKLDLFQANARRHMVCKKDEFLTNMRPSPNTNVYPYEVELSNSNKKSNTCNYPVAYWLESGLTQLNTTGRTYFENTYDGQYLTTENEIYDYDSIAVESDSGKKFKTTAFTEVRNFLMLPMEREIHCTDSSGNVVVEKVVIDFPKFASNPIQDLKTLKPKFIDKDLEEVYYLTDPTLHGLYTPAFPCYYHYQEKARKLGLLTE